ncbi:Lipoprotein signal peptidase [Candidatus Sulfopaludibacter sp. SbA4]|nr:Lipoprotein signal peptidase [Candidatus Sulfopaludibacter sp. SbA4]
MADLRLKAYGAAAVVFALDRLTKWIIETRVSFFDSYPIIPGFFDIVRSQNRGVAFGLFNNSTSEWRTTILVAASVAAVGLVSAMLWNTQRLDRLAITGLSLILGGAAGNVFDRIVWGQVTDFLDFYIGNYHWYTFNLGDSAIVIGSGLLLLHLFRPKEQAANVP